MTSSLAAALPSEPSTDVMVSSESLYGDEVWYLDDANRSVNRSTRKVDWRVRLHDGSLLTALHQRALYLACKRFLYALLLGKAVRGTVKASTLTVLFESLRRLVVWMSEHGYQRFADLNDTAISAYIIATKAVPGRTGEPAMQRTIYGRFLALPYLRDLGEYIGDTPTYDLRDRELTQQIGRAGEGIPYIPDPISVPLFQEALHLVCDVGPQLVRLRRLLEDTYQNEARRLSAESGRNAAVRRVIKQSNEVLKISGRDVRASGLKQRDVAHLIRDLNAACYIVVAGFTGMRVSEVASLDVGCLQTLIVEDVPTLVLNGELVKTAPFEKSRERWVAGPDGPQNPVRQAVELLTEMWSAERVTHSVNALFVNFGNRGKVTNLTGVAINERLARFLERVPAAGDWAISSHQFRKTFARFVARNESMAILALKRHFKHLDVQMTARYVGTDRDLIAEVLMARDEFAAEILDEVLGSERLGGALGEVIAARNSEFRGVAGADARSRQGRLLLENTDIVPLPHRYGVCFYRADVASCQGDRAMIGIDTCVGCRNFIVSSRHVPYWQSRRDQLRQFREASSDAMSPVREAAIDGEIEVAEGIISLIDGWPR